MKLKDKVAIISGASSGIGLAASKKLAEEGARLLMIGLHGDKAKKAATEVGHDAIGLGCNVASETEVIGAVDLAIQKFGGLDIIVNNAGVMIFKPLEQLTLEDWRSVFDVDLMGAFSFIKQAFLKMRPGGSIINIASIHAVETTPLVSTYAAAKAALVSLTRSASMEGTARKIRVNAILPGAIDTPMLWENPNVRSGLEQIDRGMVGKPEDIANVIAFLASDDSAFIRGASLTVDGGRLGKL